MRILLFDIDGTLISSGGAGRRAIERAFALYTKRDEAVITFDLGGMTDRAIVRIGLESGGHSATEAAIDTVLQLYLECLGDELPRSTDYKIFPGVRDVVEATKKERGVAVGLGTGNVRAGASLKLGRGDLSRYFGFGGFGCDHENRATLIKQGIARGAAELGVAPDRCSAVIIGDTPRDVAAAHANGAKCLAVATGRHRVDELENAGADWVVPDLTAPGVLDRLLS